MQQGGSEVPMGALVFVYEGLIFFLCYSGVQKPLMAVAQHNSPAIPKAESCLPSLLCGEEGREGSNAWLGISRAGGEQGVGTEEGKGHAGDREGAPKGQ